MLAHAEAFVTEADVAWFEANPDRMFRLRWPESGEPPGFVFFFCPTPGQAFKYDGVKLDGLGPELAMAGDDEELELLFLQLMQSRIIKGITPNAALALVLYDECRRRGRRMTLEEREAWARRLN
jgi:hypothetical protein